MTRPGDPDMPHDAGWVIGWVLAVALAWALLALAWLVG